MYSFWKSHHLYICSPAGTIPVVGGVACSVEVLWCFPRLFTFSSKSLCPGACGELAQPIILKLSLPIVGALHHQPWDHYVVLVGKFHILCSVAASRSTHFLCASIEARRRCGWHILFHISTYPRLGSCQRQVWFCRRFLIVWFRWAVSVRDMYNEAVIPFHFQFTEYDRSLLLVVL